MEPPPRLEGPFTIQHRHFDAAFSAVLPSVSARDQKRYLQTRANLSRARAAPSSSSEQPAASSTEDAKGSGAAQPAAPSEG